MWNGKKIVLAGAGCGLLANAMVANASIVSKVATADTEIAQYVPFSGIGPDLDSRGVNAFVIQTQYNSGTFSAALFYFDLSAYAGQTVTADGAMTIYTTYSDAAITAKMSQVTAEWKGLAAGEATYNKLGNILGTELSAGAVAANPGSQFKAVTFIVPKATLQSWIDAPASNFGVGVNALYVYPSNPFSSVFINSLEGDASHQTALSFDAVAVPEPSSIGLLGVCGLLLLRRK